MKCPGTKVKHLTKSAAHAHRCAIAKHHRRRGIHTPGKRLTVYYCPTCLAWHVGHQHDELSPSPS